MGKLFPMLSCADLSRSLEFYGELIGGIENYRFPEQGDPAFVALMIGDSSEVGLGRIAAEPLHGHPQRPAAGHRIELCVYVEDVDEAYSQAGERGFDLVTAPAEMPWGERVAWIADPDGNLVMLAK